MNKNQVVVFVCEHGAAKSILAATYFSRLAKDMGSDLRAVARGINLESEVSPQVIEGLARDGLAPIESVPQKLTEADIQSAQQVITFCDLPAEYSQPARIERWKQITPVSDNYTKARDAIVERLRKMLNH